MGMFFTRWTTMRTSKLLGGVGVISIWGGISFLALNSSTHICSLPCKGSRDLRPQLTLVQPLPTCSTPGCASWYSERVSTCSGTSLYPNEGNFSMFFSAVKLSRSFMSSAGKRNREREQSQASSYPCYTEWHLLVAMIVSSPKSMPSTSMTLP